MDESALFDLFLLIFREDTDCERTENTSSQVVDPRVFLDGFFFGFVTIFKFKRRTLI